MPNNGSSTQNPTPTKETDREVLEILYRAAVPTVGQHKHTQSPSKESAVCSAYSVVSSS